MFTENQTSTTPVRLLEIYEYPVRRGISLGGESGGPIGWTYDPYDHSASTRILLAFTAASRRSFLSCGANALRSLS